MGRDSCHKAGYEEGKNNSVFLLLSLFCNILYNPIADDAIFLAAEQGAIVIRRGQAHFHMKQLSETLQQHSRMGQKPAEKAQTRKNGTGHADISRFLMDKVRQ